MKKSTNLQWENLSLYLVIASVLSLAGLLLFYLSPYDFGLSTFGEPKKVYFADHISEVYLEIIDEFNEIHDGEIEIVPVDLPFEKFTTNERKEILSRFLRGNDVIDIFVVDQIWVPRFAKWGADLNPYFGDFVSDSLLPYAAKTSYVEDRLVSIPIHIDLGVMYYRKDLLSSIPGSDSLVSSLKTSVTWEDLFELQTAQNDFPLFVFQGDDYESLVCNYIELLGMEGEYPDSYQNINPVRGIKALLNLERIISGSGVNRGTLSKLRENSSYEYFFESGALFLRGWPSTIRDMQQMEIPDSLLNQLELAALPHFESTTPQYIIGGWNMMISRFTSKAEEAAEFVRFMMSEKNQYKIYKSRNHLPTNINLYDRASLENDPQLAYYYNLIKNGIHRPFSSNYTRNSDVLSYYLNEFVKGEITAEKTLEIVAKKINEEDFIIR